MNGVDVVLLLLLLLAVLRGARRGALAQLASLVGLIAGVLLGARVAPLVAEAFAPGPGLRLALLTVAAVGVVAAVGAVVGGLVGHRLRTLAERAGLGIVDRVVGVLLGAAGLLVVVWLTAAALAQGPVPLLSAQLSESRMLGTVSELLPPPPDVVGRLGAYLDRRGFPQVFAGLGDGPTAPAAAPPSPDAVSAAAERAVDGVVQVRAPGCEGLSAGTGFVVRPGFVVTNAHVVAGAEQVSVYAGRLQRYDAVPVLVDADVDLAVLAAPDLPAPPLPFVTEPVTRDEAGATLGFSGGSRQLGVSPAVVRGAGEAIGRDIYGGDLVTRDIVALDADVEEGDSGGPFVTAAGEVGGVVFAAASDEPGVGYALEALAVLPLIDRAVQSNTPVETGECRFS